MVLSLISVVVDGVSHFLFGKTPGLSSSFLAFFLVILPGFSLCLSLIVLSAGSVFGSTLPVHFPWVSILGNLTRTSRVLSCLGAFACILYLECFFTDTGHVVFFY